MHVDEFVRGKGFFAITGYVPTDERANRTFPLLLTTGRILSQYNVGAQTRRTENSVWHPEDMLEIHPHRRRRAWHWRGRLGAVSKPGREYGVARQYLSGCSPGWFTPPSITHCPGANVITTDNSDWATNCPEYKVTAVQVSRVSDEPSAWQARQQQFDRRQQALLDTALPG